MSKETGNITSVFGKLGKIANVRLSRDEALRYLGYTGQDIDDDLGKRFEELCLAVEAGATPAAVFTSYKIGKSDQAAVAFDGCTLTLPGIDIAEHLDGAVGAALVACTLGTRFDRDLRMLELKSPADALMFNAAGSAYVEAYANAVEAHIVACAHERDLHTGAFRFSPGYGDLPLDVQPTFLNVLDAPRKIGLNATDANLLVPVKSITAVIGLFETASTDSNIRSACEICQLQGACSLRERGVTCHD